MVYGSTLVKPAEKQQSSRARLALVGVCCVAVAAMLSVSDNALLRNARKDTEVRTLESKAHQLTSYKQTINKWKREMDEFADFQTQMASQNS